MAREPQAGPPSVVAMHVAGPQTEVPNEDQGRVDAPASGQDKKRGVELGFRARCDHQRPRVPLFDGEGRAHPLVSGH